VLIRNGHGQVDGKSLMNLITLAASYGQELTLVFEGEDAKAAAAEIQSLFLNRFGERE
jgi:phosphocarrier protein